MSYLEVESVEVQLQLFSVGDGLTVIATVLRQFLGATAEKLAIRFPVILKT